MIAFWLVSREEERQIKEDDIYGEASRDDLVDGDELTPEEAGFMKGYTEDNDG